jgi:hypothetical protein
MREQRLSLNMTQRTVHPRNRASSENQHCGAILAV